MDGKERLKLAKEALESGAYDKDTIEYIFPELKESGDEMTKNEIIAFVEQAIHRGGGTPVSQEMENRWIAWLEKQGPKENTWNKEDEENMNNAIYIFNQLKDSSSYKEDDIAEKTINWFKSIKDRLCSYNEYDKDILGAIDYCIRFNRPLEKEHVSWLVKQGKKETLCDKCRKEHPSHSCQDITALGRCAVEHEQKPVDKVEPKFHKGDWVVSMFDSKARQISEVHYDEYNNYYVVNGNEYNIEEYDRLHYLWTIKDGKNGDVLVDEDNNICIYKEIEGLYWHSYIYLGCDGKLRGFSIGGSHKQTDTHPASKEQRDTLMKAMSNAGYIFDFEKGLKKIEQESAWCEDDEAKIVKLKSFIAQCKGFNKENRNKVFDLIDSIKDSYAWKPSKEQLDALEHFVRSVSESGYASPYDQNTKLLCSLLQDLKKL